MRATKPKPWKEPAGGSGAAPPKVIRCAIYTRKSTEEGLNQEFNSLDAQREAAEAYIKSQVAEGWTCLGERFDDGGFSGGNVERPALQRLLEAVRNRHVDAVVVYKVDRLSRSLMDFARLMGAFEKHGVSFVSVTQAFNTTHSMGRLTLNILLSFAQFEREIISERIKDKLSASRKKGKFVGGCLILGYDRDPTAVRLVVNPEEAERVRRVFDQFLKRGSLSKTARDMNTWGWRRKSWTGKKGHQCGGGEWTDQNLRDLLVNPAYIGKVRYKGEIYQAEHEAILDEGTWQKVQELLARPKKERIAPSAPASHSLLRGILVCGHCGVKMAHSSTNGAKRRYRYYICSNALKRGYAACTAPTLPAGEIEAFVVERIRRLGQDGELAAEVARKARLEAAERIAALRVERNRLQVAQRQQERRAESCARKPDEAGTLATLHEELRQTHERIQAIDKELASPGRPITDRDVSAALQHFDGVWDGMDPAERSLLMGLLVEQVVYDKAKSSVSITFHPTGIANLAHPKEPSP